LGLVMEGLCPKDKEKVKSQNANGKWQNEKSKCKRKMANGKMKKELIIMISGLLRPKFVIRKS
jgi:hypothetical protein